jgi:hypothetical protein
MTRKVLAPLSQRRWRLIDGRFRCLRGGVGPSLLLLLVVACAGGSRGSPFDRSQNMDQVVLRVENQNTYEASIYLRPGGIRHLLGKVDSRGLQFFQFEWAALTPLSLEIETLIGERYRPPPFPFTPGIRVELMVASELRRSALRQRSPSRLRGLQRR